MEGKNLKGNVVAHGVRNPMTGEEFDILLLPARI